MSDVFHLQIPPLKQLSRLAHVLVVSTALTACGGLAVEGDYPQDDTMATQESGSVFDFFKFGGDTAAAKATADDEAGAGEQSAPGVPQGLGVNADLWRAALETVSFLPLASADPMGGTIITDWYNDPGQNNERVKLTVVISGLELRADALRVSVFREGRVNGRWRSTEASSTTARQMENIILTKARDFYIARTPR